MSDEKKEIITIPWWPGPKDDEWDSPGYDAFWHPVECAIDEKIKNALAAGKKVELVEPK